MGRVLNDKLKRCTLSPSLGGLVQIGELLRRILSFLDQDGYMVWLTFVRSVIVTCNWRLLVPQEIFVRELNWGSFRKLMFK
jgi:hypothetical protein